MPTLNEKRAVSLTLAGSLLLWSYLLFKKYFLLGYYDWDLAICSQALWKLGTFNAQSTLMGTNFFGNHTNFIAILFVPLFRFFGHPLLLIAMKIAAFHAGALSVFVLMRSRCEGISSFLMMLTFLVFAPNVMAMTYEFAFDCLLMAILPWMVHFFLVKDTKAFWLTAILAMSVKENMPLVLISAGIASLFMKGRNKIIWSLVPIVIGSLLFYLFIGVLMPVFRGLSYHAHLSRYDYLGTSVQEVLLNLLLEPRQTVKILLHPMNVHFLSEMFSGLLLPSLGSPLVLFLSAPLFALHLVSTHYPEKLITYHYSHTLVPFIFMASIQTFAYVNGRWGEKIVRALMVGVLIICLIQLYGYRQDIVDQLHYKDAAQASARWRMIEKIPPDAGVITTFEFMAPLSLRGELYSFQKLYDKFYQEEHFAKQTPYYQEHKFTLPASVKFAFIDFDDEWIRVILLTEDVKSVEKLEQIFYKENWRLLDAFGHALLLERMALGSESASQESVGFKRLVVEGREINIRVFQ